MGKWCRDYTMRETTNTRLLAVDHRPRHFQFDARHWCNGFSGSEILRKSFQWPIEGVLCYIVGFREQHAGSDGAFVQKRVARASARRNLSYEASAQSVRKSAKDSAGTAAAEWSTWSDT